MNELIQQIVARTNISEDAAAKAVDTVLAYLREKLPAPVAAQVESYLGSGVTGESIVGRAKSIWGAFRKE